MRHVAHKASLSKDKVSIILISLAAVVFLIGAFIVLAANLGIFNQPPHYQEAPVVANPFNKDSSDTYTAQAKPATESPIPPSTLSIPAIGVRAAIVETAIDKNGLMELPHSEKVGFLSSTSPVGSATGSTLIAGHVNFADGSPGALGSLAVIQKGTPIVITDKVGTKHYYKVTGAQTLVKVALPDSLFTTSGSPQLTLVTCGGAIEMVHGALAYTHNTVITAIPVDDPIDS